MRLKALLILTLHLVPFFLLANADLTVTTVQSRTLSIPPYFADGSTEVDFVIQNIGNQTAQSYWVHVFSTQGPSCSGALILEDAALFPALPPGQSISGTFVIHSRPGDQRIYGVVKADATNLIIENNETNNCKTSLAIVVQYPDLRVSHTQYQGPFRIVPGGDSKELSATIRNFEPSGNGSGWPSGESNVRYYLSTATSNPPLVDRLPLIGPTPPLDVNEEANIISLVEAPISLALGTYNLFAQADGDNQVIEGRENNNFSAAIPVEVVDFCTLADVDGDGLVTILDLVSLANSAVVLVTEQNQHLNLRRSPFPFPEMINRTDLLAALPCFGTFEFNPEDGGTLDSLGVRAVAGGGYEVFGQINGQVSGIEVYIKTPLGFPLSTVAGRDVLGNENLQSLSTPDGALILANEYNSTFNHTSTISGEQVVATFDVPGINLTKLAPVIDPMDFTSGVSVKVLFGDGTSQVRSLRFAYVDIPDPVFRTYVEGRLNLAPNAPIADNKAVTLSTINVDSLGVNDLTGIRRFTSLRSLSAQHNNLTQTPDLRNLARLNSLALSFNQLKTLPPLPASISFLGVSFNLLTSMPDLSAHTYMWGLDISYNQLTTVPDLSMLHQLQFVAMMNNRISSLPPLPLELGTLMANNNLLSSLPDLTGHSFEHLDLYNNYLSSINQLTGLVWPAGAEIYLENNNLDSRACEDLKILSLQGVLSGSMPQRIGYPCEFSSRR